MMATFWFGFSLVTGIICYFMERRMDSLEKSNEELLAALLKQREELERYKAKLKKFGKV